MKKVLVAWGFSAVWADVEGALKALKVGTDVVATATVVDNTFHCEWAPKLRKWELLQNSNEVKELLEKATGALANQSAKGKGKSKSFPE